MSRSSFAVAAATVCLGSLPLCPPVAAQVADYKPVTKEILAKPDPADWLMINRTYDEQRFSPLKDIDRGNVGQLRMEWVRGLPAGTNETTPIVWRGTM